MFRMCLVHSGAAHPNYSNEENPFADDGACVCVRAGGDSYDADNRLGFRVESSRLLRAGGCAGR